LWAFEKKALRRIVSWSFERGNNRTEKLHSEELHALYSSPNIISDEMSWTCNMHGIVRNAYNVLVLEPERKTPFGRSRRRWEEEIKIDLNEVRCEGLD
jgi:hypothetical protein